MALSYLAGDKELGVKRGMCSTALPRLSGAALRGMPAGAEGRAGSILQRSAMMEALHDFVLPYSSPVRNVRVAARGKQMKSKSLLTTGHPTPRRRRRRTLVDIVIRLVARSTVAAAHSRVTCTAAV